MPRSSPARTSWSFDSDRNASAERSGARGLAPVELRDVSLRFLSYRDKSLSLKRAALNLFLKREEAPPSDDFWALRDVNLALHSGDRVGIVGSNGAGKSTLLRLMARIYPPTRGSVAVRGVVAPLIEMGAGFNPELSGIENILLNGAMLGFSKRAMLAKVEEIFEFTGLREFASLPLKYFSSGMYQRLAFGVATQIQSDVLLVDESLGVGDASFAAKAKTRIGELVDRSQVVVIVSHDLGLLLELCTRGIWMKRGQVVLDGPIHEVVTTYLSEVQATSAA